MNAQPENTANPYKILVIDDDPHVLRTLSDVLTSLGHIPHTAASGDKGIAAYRTQPYDLVLLDLSLPNGLNGIETLTAIRETSEDQKVILISGCPHPILLAAAREKGAHRYLIKPITREDLHFTIQAEMARS